MADPKQSTAKVVLNAATYKETNDGQYESLASVGIDITDLLEQNNVLPSRIYGISVYDGLTGELVPQAPGRTAFVVTDIELRQMVDEIYTVIDAAIVNTNQSKASKRLIDNILVAFLSKCWDKIRG